MVHLMKDAEPTLSETRARFPIAGDNVVDAVRFEILAAENAEDAKCEEALRSLRTLRQKENAGRVYINATQYFDNVPVSAWEQPIGGYRPAEKWLKDRKGRVLTQDDLKHYQRIILALSNTREIMEQKML